MEVITIESAAFQEIIGKIEGLQHLLESNAKQPKEVWLDNDELIKLLKISKRLAQTYRDEGRIAFSQIGNKIFYRLSDIERMLMSHYNASQK
jgi:hypothetical protein